MNDAIELLKKLKRDLMQARRFLPDTLDTYRRACVSAEGDIEEFLASNAAPVEQAASLTDSYVQTVPDKCDRIVWRGCYYHLPVASQAAPVTVPNLDLLKRVTDVAAMLYSAWENGLPCYEDPDDCTGYLGNAFMLDDGADDHCVRIINEAEAALATAPAPSADAQNANWRTFGAKVLQSAREHMSDVDGGDIQDWAEEAGLLVKHCVYESCGEHCIYAEVGFPSECYRYSDEASAAIDAALSAQEGDVK